MKVIFINSSMGRGATTRILVELSRKFCNVGEEAFVWGLYKEYDTYLSEKDSYCILKKYPKFYQIPSLFIVLIRELKKHNPDIIFCSLPFANILGSIAGRIAGVKCIISIHHNVFPNITFFRRWAEVVLGVLGFYSNRVCVSEAVKKSYSFQFDPFKSRLKVIHNSSLFPPYNGNKLEARTIFNLPTKEFIAVTVGRLTKEKNQIFLLNIIAKIPDCHLLFCGEGELEVELRKTSKKLNIENRVHFIGHIPPREVPHLLTAADIFLFSSLYEGFGMAVLEAMQAGLPVISSDIPAVCELLGDSGYLLPFDQNVWIEKIKLLKKSESKREEISKKCLEQSTLFSKEIMMNKFLKLSRSSI